MPTPSCLTRLVSLGGNPLKTHGPRGTLEVDVSKSEALEHEGSIDKALIFSSALC